jgi:hypothetical protein
MKALTTYLRIIFLFISLSLSSIIGFAQSPQTMSYQAVVRDGSNVLVTNHAVSMRISILHGSATGNVVFTETQNTTTNANGLVSIAIGIESGFAAIDWSAGSYFIKTETDATGGSDYSIVGVSQLLSVPYALYAKSSGTSLSGPKGDQGLPGKDGVDGKDGALGLQGIAGKDGSNGKSAYQIWKESNNVGDTTVFLSALKGEKGDQGLSGKDGIDGINGKDGAQGIAGKDGINGTNGIDGKDGATGLQGLPGKDGIDGINGKDGAQGIAGKDGINGTNGKDGLTTSVNGVTQVNGAITLTKSDIGLSTVDNTSDINKPISTATQTALNAKVNTAALATVATTGNFSDLKNIPTTVAGYGITDAMNTSSAANTISSADIANWKAAYGWGNHATAGYLKSYTETDPKVGTNGTNYTSKWNGTALVKGTIYDNGSIGIGTAVPDNSAILDVESTSQGVALPSLTDAQRAGINTPKEGLLIFNTTTKNFNVFKSGNWYEWVASNCVPQPTIANAGNSFSSSNTSVTLAANTPNVGSGLWTIIAGSGGAFANPSSATTSFTGIFGAVYDLRWTIANSCNSSSSDITVALTSCTDGILDGTETDIDCGGSCSNKCSTGKKCIVSSDCLSGSNCVTGVCSLPSCFDGIKNQTETDIDCGGGTCSKCITGKYCSMANDCQSSVCSGGICQAPSCYDGVKNGSESDIDCGGSCSNKCDLLQKCLSPDDCSTGLCKSGICQPYPIVSCMDGIWNQMETDVDCGGGSCAPCSFNKMCNIGTDCQSGVCGGGMCKMPTCFDAVKNGNETDVDCGGGTCNKCASTKICLVGSDCTSGSCVANKCQ